MTAAKVNPMSEAFGEIIARYRRQKGWTLRTLSQQVGLSSRHMGLLESGQNFPSICTLFVLAETFGLRPSDLVRELEEVVVVKKDGHHRR